VISNTRTPCYGKDNAQWDKTVETSLTGSLRDTMMLGGRCTLISQPYRATFGNYYYNNGVWLGRCSSGPATTIRRKRAKDGETKELAACYQCASL